MEDWLRTTVDELREYLAGEEIREDNADQRAKAIMEAVQSAAKLQADATLRGHQELADAIRGLTEELRRQR